MNKDKLILLLVSILFIIVLVVAFLLYNNFKDKKESDLSFIGALGSSQEGEDEESAPPMMPNLPLFTLEDEETDLATVSQGKPIIINYFASWCPPCKQEMPHFVQAYENYKEEITFIFLDALDGQRETKEDVKKFASEYGMQESSIYYDQGLFSYFFQTTSLPTTVFITSEGIIHKGYLGMINEATLTANIADLLQ